MSQGAGVSADVSIKTNCTKPLYEVRNDMAEISRCPEQCHDLRTEQRDIHLYQMKKQEHAYHKQNEAGHMMSEAAVL